jgi:hypothetical protein
MQTVEFYKDLVHNLYNFSRQTQYGIQWFFHYCATLNDDQFRFIVMSCSPYASPFDIFEKRLTVEKKKIYFEEMIKAQKFESIYNFLNECTEYYEEYRTDKSRQVICYLLAYILNHPEQFSEYPVLKRLVNACLEFKDQLIKDRNTACTLIKGCFDEISLQGQIPYWDVNLYPIICDYVCFEAILIE